MLLPPNAYRADRHAIVEHYRIVSKAGLPIVAYNNTTPRSTSPRTCWPNGTAKASSSA
ncbi:hypothetical protein [Saccharopolyspora sp. ASAGF58]|uniref:hypothetical protein n=1 Tax=Saccharopolyspora sp. ASAGF58 TaxID=2719023 RepID=UPI001FF0C031|nr:hypothetical protein [Saccharopolyspora sp. ASAGF58]